MEGYELISTNDDKCIGHVVGRVGDYLIVEHGTLRKTKNAIPLAFADVDDGARRVTTTLAHELVYDSPKVNGGGFDEVAVAQHYGLAESEAPVSEGYGDLDANELDAGAERDYARTQSAAPPEDRARMRESLRPEGDRGADESPGLLGDRYKS